MNFFCKIDSNHVKLPAFKRIFFLVNIAGKITSSLTNLLSIQYFDILGVTNDEANFSINNIYLS